MFNSSTFHEFPVRFFRILFPNPVPDVLLKLVFSPSALFFFGSEPVEA